MRNFIKCNLVTNNFYYKIWSGKCPLWILLLPFSLIYGLISNIIRLVYKLGLRKSWRAPVPIIVVGNITVGGSGKTPFVIWLVEQFKNHGILVGVISRGYKSKAKHYPILLNNQTTTNEAGDESILIYQRTGVPVAVDSDRKKAILKLLDKNILQVIISDDGLQHYAQERDVEIVIIDGNFYFGNGWWIPAGPMRERESRLSSVDIVIINGGNKEKYNEIYMNLIPGSAVNLLTGKKHKVSLLNNLIAIAGIGNPSRFFSTLKQSGAKLLKCFPLEDHEELSVKELNKFVCSEQNLIMTEKDAVKYRSFAKSNWWYLPVYVSINDIQSKFLLKYLISFIVN